jgi:NAD(P)-dependent dehydrogenase (short-subunit alcohol dehydrogenase family)
MVVGGTSGLGREVARYFAASGDAVIVTGRDPARAKAAAKEIGAEAGLGFDLAEPLAIGPALDGVPLVDYLVIAAIERDVNTVASYDAARATRLVTLKLVGYTQVVHVMRERVGSSVVLFGGLAKERPYPGSTTVTTVNGGITSMVRALALELAPVRVNAIHPGIVGDSPYWRDKDLSGVVARTPSGRLPQMSDIVDAVVFLLRNPAITGTSLHADAGWLLT